ncbi:dihydrodipicolinate synthase family protein [Lampropedia puyangensis]|uniref:Dihydrodipicolinate synthase family protein n=1 Tax=Lampropedia puyangensis TaxID=1330072 RepID=A0A4S8F3K5_9BURK|nr:dihydrodipicolinate synthase family protein [Lampropedia puyangensis]THU01539.1 dihydrodipicolinate synthase family protein [Lampropedia puyangensis]
MGSKSSIEGVLTAVVTPMDQNYGFNELGFREQIERQIIAGNGIFCGGTNGEFFALTEAEKCAVVDVAVDQAAKRVPVVGHVGEIATTQSIRAGRYVAAAGVDAVAVITPYFVPLSQQELVAHFSAIADALEVPVYLYNIPARTGNTIEPATAAQLASHPNIVGIKDSAGSYESLQGFLAIAKDCHDFSVFNGPDHLIHQGFLDGCAGCVSGLANVAPREVQAVWSHFHAGDVVASEQAQKTVSRLREQLYKVAFAPAAVKRAVRLLGYPVGDSKYPTQIGPQQDAQISAILAELNLRY